MIKFQIIIDQRFNQYFRDTLYNWQNVSRQFLHFP